MYFNLIKHPKTIILKKIKFVNLSLKKGITDSAECYLLKEIKKKMKFCFNKLICCVDMKYREAF